METRTASLLLAALLVLAGCAGSQQATTTEATTDGELTTEGAPTTAGNATTDRTATPTATGTATADLPPGVNASGVENATELLAAHRAALSESGFAFRLVTNASYERLTDSRSVATGAVAKEFAPFRIRSDVTARRDARTIRGETDAWGNESVVLYRYRLANRTSYQKSRATLDGAATAAEDNTPDGLASPPVNVADLASQSFVVEFALRTGEYEVASVETRDGLTLTTLLATGYDRDFEDGFENVSRYDSTLVVDQRGRVRGLDTTLVADEASVRLDFDLTKVGGVVVPYPRWADRALAVVSAEIDLDADSGGNYFVVSNDGGDTLPPGSQVRVAHAGVNATLELTAPLAPGEAVYVYFPADGGRPVLAADPPAGDEAAPLDGEYEFEVTDPAGNALLNVGFGFETATANATVGASDGTTADGSGATADGTATTAMTRNAGR